MQKSIKYTALVASALFVGEAVAVPSSSFLAQANEPAVSSPEGDTDPAADITYTDQELKDAKEELVNKGVYTNDQLQNFSDKELVYVDQQLNTAKPKVGTSTVAKAVSKAWKKLPASVKKTIGKYTGLNGFLSAIDHYTGTEYHIIYSACKKVGMSKNTADFVTKTITLFI